MRPAFNLRHQEKAGRAHRSNATLRSAKSYESGFLDRANTDLKSLLCYEL